MVVAYGWWQALMVDVQGCAFDQFEVEFVHGMVEEVANWVVLSER